MKAELEETKISMEKRIREQIETEMKERLEKEAQLKRALEEQESHRQKEEELRNQFAAQKREQEAAKAKVNQEIHQGMERLRLEKEKESKTPTRAPAPTLAPTSNKMTPPEPTPGTSPSSQELDDPFIRQTLAEIYAKQGFYVEALKIYERILNDEPNNEEVKEKLRDILRLKGM